MNLRETDIRNLWHPYTNIETFRNSEFPIIVKADGITLTDSSGKTYFDGISSWWCVNLGHSHPYIVNSIAGQLDSLQQSITGGMSHDRVIELAAKLSAITPGDLNRVYLASDGASSVEAAIRIAVQFWWNNGKPEKKNIISISGGYHGDTLGAVGLGFIPAFHRSIEHVVARAEQAPSPHCFHCPFDKEPGCCSIDCFKGMEELVVNSAGTTAAVIAEPVCQGAAGIRIYPPEYVSKLRKLCSRESVLLILDEIAVGFGRTGRMFASDLAEVSPDIMILGKSLTAGYLPMSAAVVTDEIYDSFRSKPGMDRTFYHGHTFSGNPLASAAACAAIDVFTRDSVIDNNRKTAEIMSHAFNRFNTIPGVHRSVSLGWMSSLEVSENAGGAGSAAAIASNALKKGLLIRPLGRVLYLWPPLTANGAEMCEMLSIFEDSLREILS